MKYLLVRLRPRLQLSSRIDPLPSANLQVIVTHIENLMLSILGKIWHWSVYGAGHVFYFWAWPLVVMPALFKRKHQHIAVTVLVRKQDLLEIERELRRDTGEG